MDFQLFSGKNITWTKARGVVDKDFIDMFASSLCWLKIAAFNCMWRVQNDRQRQISKFLLKKIC